MRILCKKMVTLNVAVMLIITLLLGSVPVYALSEQTVTYYGLGGTTSIGASSFTQTVESLSSVTVMGSDLFTNEGRTFLYWRDSRYNIYQEGKAYDLTNYTSLYAQWGYARITYYGNGGLDADGCTESESYVSYRGSSSYNLGTIFTRDGYVFVGWNSTADGSGEWYRLGASCNTGGHLTLYAQWEVDQTGGKYIRYCDNGSGLFGGKSYFYVPVDTFPASVELLPMQDTAEKTYIGWSANATHWSGNQESELSYAPGDTIEITENTTFYAWSITNSSLFSSPTIHVIYYGNGGSNAIGSTVKSDAVSYSDLVLYGSDAFEKENAILTSWNTKKDGSGQTYDFFQTLTQSQYTGETIRLFAQWKEENRSFIHYNGDGGTTSDGSTSYYQIVESYDSVTLQSGALFEKPGYEFIGWTDSAGNKYYEGQTYSFSGKTTLTAQWGYARVTYHGNGGTAVDPDEEMVQYVTSKSSWNPNVTKMGSVFSNSGYAFIGWNTESDGSGDWYPEKAVIGQWGIIDLYAQWDETSDSCIRYSANGSDIFGGKSYQYVDVAEYPAQVTLLPMQDTAEKTYIGWSANATHWSGNQESELSYAPGDTIEITENTTFYAWSITNSSLFSSPTIHVIYYGNGGSNAIGSTVKSDAVSYSDLVLYGSDAFEKEGYAFTGWNTKADGSGQKYTAGETLMQSSYKGTTTRLFAQWEFDPLAEHTLIFEESYVPSNSKLLAATYDENGKMICITEASVVCGYIQANILCTDYNKMSYAKLFIIDATTYSPLCDCQTLYRSSSQ